MKDDIKASVAIKFTRKPGDIVYLVSDDFIKVETAMIMSVTESTVIFLVENQERKFPHSLAEILLMSSYEQACDRAIEASKWTFTPKQQTKTKP